MMHEGSIHDQDFYRWTKTQASFLKKKEFGKLDIDYLIEEIESLGRSEKRAIKSFLVVLLLHLLKVEYQPGKHTRSWDLSIQNAKHEIKLLLAENPSLKRQLSSLTADAYFTARLKAIDETGLDEQVFPEDCPWEINTLKELISPAKHPK
jgi:hypothetical protein